DEEVIRRAPGAGVRSVPYPQVLRIPDGEQIRLDRQLKAQPSRASGGVLEGVLYDQPRLAVRTELKSLDLQAVQHRTVSEPIAIGVVDELGALGQGGVLTGRQVSHLGPETVDQLDRVEPQPTHFARDVVAHVREIPVLRADQVGPVACRDIGLVLVVSMVAYP